jgi:hypothetical protein
VLTEEEIMTEAVAEFLRISKIYLLGTSYENK